MPAWPGAGYGQINGVNVAGLVQPFASASLSLPAGLNFEAYGSLPIGAGGNLSDPSATGTPLSFRLGAGLGVQIPFGDYAIGAEIGVVREFANARTPTAPGAPGAPEASYGNVSALVEYRPRCRQAPRHFRRCQPVSLLVLTRSALAFPMTKPRRPIAHWAGAAKRAQRLGSGGPPRPLDARVPPRSPVVRRVEGVSARAASRRSRRPPAVGRRRNMGMPSHQRLRRSVRGTQAAIVGQISAVDLHAYPVPSRLRASAPPASELCRLTATLAAWQRYHSWISSNRARLDRKSPLPRLVEPNCLLDMGDGRERLAAIYVDDTA